METELHEEEGHGDSHHEHLKTGYGPGWEVESMSNFCDFFPFCLLLGLERNIYTLNSFNFSQRCEILYMLYIYNFKYISLNLYITYYIWGKREKKKQQPKARKRIIGGTGHRQKTGCNSH